MNEEISRLASELAKLKELVAGSYRFGMQLRQELNYRAAEGSVAHTRLSEDPGDSWPNAKDAFARGYQFLAIGEDHLFSYSKLIDEEPPLFGYMPMSRAAIEAFGRAWWILDPSLDRSTLLTRGAIERIYNLREETAGLIKADRPEAKSKQKLLDSLKEECEAAGLSVVFGKGKLPRQFTVNGVRRPSATKLNEEFMMASGFSRTSTLIYELFSGASHSLYFALGEQMEVVEDKGKLSAHFSVNFDQMRQPGMAALFAWRAVMDRIHELNGWETSEWLSWRRHLNRTLASFIPPERRSSGLSTQFPSEEGTSEQS